MVNPGCTAGGSQEGAPRGRCDHLPMPPSPFPEPAVPAGPPSGERAAGVESARPGPLQADTQTTTVTNPTRMT